jgi:hypothetical protein
MNTNRIAAAAADDDGGGDKNGDLCIYNRQ